MREFFVSAAFCLGWMCSQTSYAAIQVRVSLDKDTVALDDTVALKFSVSSDAATTSSPEISFRAPDFEVVNNFQSTSMSAGYDSDQGRYAVQKNVQVTKVLRPTKVGNLKISSIEVKTGKEVHRNPDLTVKVEAEGSSRGSGFGPQGRSQSPSQSRREKEADETSVFVKAEVDSETAYKGQQLILSYYLYHRGKVLHLSADTLPSLNGFLREDLDVPVLTQRFHSETVQLNGKEYERTLLARYAIYPLQIGTLGIEPFAVQYEYLSNARDPFLGDEEDSFFGFFRHLAPRVGKSKSQEIQIKVEPLPKAGKPEVFSGGIGQFEVGSAANRLDVNVDEAVSIKVKVEGRGNVSSISAPKVKWPEEIDLYDSHSESHLDPTGRGEKVFEYLLIPRVPGTFDLPGLAFSFFDPVQKKYYSKATGPMRLSVKGTVSSEPHRSSPQGTQGTQDTQDTSASSSLLSSPNPIAPSDLKPPEDLGITGLLGDIPLWRFLYVLSFILFGVFLFLVLKDKIQDSRKSKSSKEEPSSLFLKEAREIAFHPPQGGIPSAEVVKAYHLIEKGVWAALVKKLGPEAASYSRSDLYEKLGKMKGLSESNWNEAVQILETSERVQYSSSHFDAEPNQVRLGLQSWIQRAETLISQF